jgi:putative DNA primase/helicase
LINTVAELPAREWLETESFKAFIGDDPINARSIYQSPFTYHSKAGHIFAANELPRINDRTNATWNRMRVLQCNQRFAAAPNPGQKKAIDGLSDLILKTERPGITAWAIRGVQRLVTQHQYTNPESSAIAIGNWQKGSDQLEHFFEDQLQLSPDPKELLARTGVFKAYSDWARLNNHKGMSSTEFYKNFPKLLQKKGILNPTTKLNGQRAYRGICARPAERDTMLEPINPGRKRSVADDEESAGFFRKLN